jgi:hypothetical protein
MALVFWIISILVFGVKKNTHTLCNYFAFNTYNSPTVYPICLIFATQQYKWFFSRLPKLQKNPFKNKKVVTKNVPIFFTRVSSWCHMISRWRIGISDFFPPVLPSLPVGLQTWNLMCLLSKTRAMSMSNLIFIHSTEKKMSGCEVFSHFT